MDRADNRLLAKHGGFRRLKSYQVAQLAFDVTVRFCDRFIDRRSRTHDQMVQAARSGVQNIAEGSQVSGTSKKMELKLTNVARASLEELRLDYEDFLRQRGLAVWERADSRRKALIAARPATADEVASWVKKEVIRQVQGNGPKGPNGRMGPSELELPEPLLQEVAANAAIALVVVAGYLLDRQLAQLAAAFEREGGFTERLYRRRQDRRNRPAG